jgi:hypothetical protein
MDKNKIKTLYPITEEYLKHYSIDNPPLISLYRNYSIQNEYDSYRSSDKFFIFIDNVKELLQKQNSLLQLNDFPYYTTDDIKHYVLWINNKQNNYNDINYNKYIFKNNNIDKEFIQSEIYKYFKTNTKTEKTENIITYWVNTQSNCSIKEILHIHIFTK